MIPLATTKISVLRQSQANLDAEPYSGTDAADRTVVAEHVRAVVNLTGGALAGGSLDVAGGYQWSNTYYLQADPIEPAHLDYRDWIKDEATDRIFRVETYLEFPGSHFEAVLLGIEGEV